jgi:uncharacterized protein YggE
MAAKKPERFVPSGVRPEAEFRPSPGPPERETEPEADGAKTATEELSMNSKGKETEAMAEHASHGRVAQQFEGVSVTGEAVTRVAPENAEFLIEIAASAPTAAQALRDNQLKLAQVAQTLSALGVQATDLQTISQNVVNLYSPGMQPALPGFGMAQIGQPGFAGFGPGNGMQADVQFGSYLSRNVIRINVRETARAGEIMDAAARAGAIVAGGFSFKSSNEATAWKATLEAAGKDARAKAEALAAAVGKQVGDPVSIAEELCVSNGVYSELRAAIPLAFGARAPRVTGELEYYARVSANFRLQ